MQKEKKNFLCTVSCSAFVMNKAFVKEGGGKNRYIPTMHLTTYCHILRSAIKEAVKFMCQLPFDFDFSIFVSLDASEELVGAQL